ncbi:MAG: hypothetical protein AB7R69_01095 [Candidatus Babeliales bacterium]
MNKNFKHQILLLLLVGSSGIGARELRTPWGLERGPFHYPVPCRSTDKEQCWNVDIWGAGLYRQSNKAFIDKMSFKTDPSLAGIIFGQNSFVGLDAFAAGVTSPVNPFLAFAQIAPRINYRESSAYFGCYIERQLPWGCDCAWRGGMRITLPFRAIDINLENCCDLEETLADVCHRQNERVDGAAIGANPTIQTVDDCFAYRLDFLSSLFLQQAGVPPFDPFVEYRRPIASTFDVAMDAAVISDRNDNPINFIRRTDGTLPEGPYCAPFNVVDAAQFINADGSGGVNNERLRGFNQNIDYTPLSNDKAAQRQLWAVPTVGQVAGTLQEFTIAQNIGTAIEQLVRNLPNAGAIGFFNEHGVDFNTQHNVGLGQMEFEFYANRDWCNWFFEGIVGFHAPTGLKVKDPGKIYKIFNTGNNRHWVAKFGGIATYDPNIWCHIKAEAFYSYVAPATERVAAPFTGATVKNIGPAVKASISWNQFVARLDTIWLVPCNPRVGWLLGYEAYFKTKDNVKLKQTTATDFLGNTHTLDPAVLEERTKVYSSKARVEMFHQGSFWELFAGWTHVFAGRNAPKETDWHIGLIAFF